MSIPPDEPALDAEPVDAPGDRKQCPLCGEMIAASAKKCRYCGHYLDPSVRPRATASTTDQFLMPVNRPISAIAAGYLGLFSLLPFFGLIAIIVALIALRTLKQDPELAGRGRAWFGLIAGIVSTLFYGIALVAAVNGR